jgi:hypothetical protein
LTIKQFLSKRRDFYEIFLIAPRHSTAAGKQAYCPSNCIIPGYFVFKNEYVKVKVKEKYHFVLHGPPFYFRIIISYLKMSGMPCCPIKVTYLNTTGFV